MKSQAFFVVLNKAPLVFVKSVYFWYLLNFIDITILIMTRGGSRTAATSKMECFVIIVNGFQSLTIITKCSILDVAAVLEPPLMTFFLFLKVT